MSEPMSTNDDARAKRQQQAAEHMKDAGIAERVKAAHPHMVESDDSLKAALADYDRLAGEKPKA